MAEYSENLEDNLRELLSRAKSGIYRAPPVRRVYIPKGDGSRLRPIGIPTVEDKILQRAVTMVLEPVYEQEFYDGSYGFRSGRSAHDALDAIDERVWKMGGGWVLEADIESFFDAVDHAKVREIFCQRVSDGVLVRLIGKWLKAGVLEEGTLLRPDTGTPQGGVISPLLANIYLHEVLDKWFLRDVQPRLQGKAHLVRYADDFVIVFERESDARRVMHVLPKRFAKYGLRLHPEKTRLVAFEKPGGKCGREPGTFDFLGFRHYWTKSRKGYWVQKKKTSPQRLSRTLKSISQWCRDNRHLHVREQHRILTGKLRGHANYFGVAGNSRALSAVRNWTLGIWRKWLSRRNNRPMQWERFNAVLKCYPLPLLRLNGR
jgi:group II intron reverse transcriptase/maturase